MGKADKENRVVYHLKDTVEEFKTILPLIEELANQVRFYIYIWMRKGDSPSGGKGGNRRRSGTGGFHRSGAGIDRRVVYNTSKPIVVDAAAMSCGCRRIVIVPPRGSCSVRTEKRLSLSLSLSEQRSCFATRPVVLLLTTPPFHLHFTSFSP
eukprot:588180-Prorocentrum_minimum.AAC.1